MSELLQHQGFREIKPRPETINAVVNPKSPLYVHMQEMWNPEHYKIPRGPIQVERFSPEICMRATQDLPTELCNIRSMPIKRPYMDKIVVPNNFEQFADMIQVVCDYQASLQMYTERHAYLTVNQGLVEPQLTQRIPGVHADGLQVGESIIVRPEQSYSCAFGLLQTVFYPSQAIDFQVLPADKRAYAAYISQMTDTSRDVVFSEEGVLYLWDSYTLHASPPNMSNVPVPRTFFRIEFSDREFGGPDTVTGTSLTPNPFLK